MSNSEYLLYEKLEGHVARIWLNRPETRNAQDTQMLYELNEAYDRAIADEDVKVIVLAAKGPDFSGGHDLREGNVREALRDRKTVGTWNDRADWEGAEAYHGREREIYDGFCRRWRELSKPTIASVQGKAIAGALMLIWPCDLVIASEDATFQDNTLFFGIPGLEYFSHPWELGIRKAKEFLLTGLPITAREAQAAGMVNRVVPREDLEARTLEFARQVSNKPSFALKLAKESVNATFSAQGFDNVQRNAFNAHHLAHTHYRLTSGSLMDLSTISHIVKKLTV